MKVLCKQFKINFNDVSLKLSTINICVVHGLCHLQKVLVRDLYYTKRGKKDAEMGDIDESTSFVSILSDSAYFKKEFSILERIAERYNSMIWFTPKYHCEIAGEGVEYMWGYCKRLFRRVPLAK